jgi:transposase InsO family protein
VCQDVLPSKFKKRAESIYSYARNERWQMDYAVFREDDTNGHNRLLVVIDHFTKRLWATSHRGESQKQVYEFLTKIAADIDDEDLPRIIQTDNGGPFLIEDWLMTHWETHHITARPYNSKCNGGVERMNR